MPLSRASLAVAYHAPVKRGFVHAVLIPAARRVRAAEGVSHVHLARHWRFGPHVQLVATGPDHGRLTEGLRAEQPVLEADVAAHPSTYRLDHEHYLALSEHLGTTELVPPPYEPIWPDNSVQLFEEPLSPGLIEDPDALDLRDAFCDALLEPLASVLEREAGDPAQRLAGASELMVLLAATYPDAGLSHGYLSYKSHLDDYMQDYDRDGATRADFSRRYERVAPAFTNLIADLVATPQRPCGYSGADPALARWSARLSQLWERAVELAATKAIDPLLHEGYTRRAGEMNDHLRRKWEVGDDREYSEFHAALRQYTYDDPAAGRDFAAYRFMVNLLYTQLLVADVSPAERLFLCHAVSEAVQATTGVSWRDVLNPRDARETGETAAGSAAREVAAE
ncbi:hypothetical protein LP52_02735 [Streptomonospora alba]|uniref:Uncharacterized protein n=1 Tax=Streptomonospora alba TaxID=183763 RepID=A0A0C2JMR4_9ACTN|nr:lantibiotic dehydratase C-terminal domain-containing protein [Streptomonospora alba]KII00241.1 hypothetical protein LP52_02735 [Streptomonospora alba]